MPIADDGDIYPASQPFLKPWCRRRYQPTNHQAKWYVSILAMSRNDDDEDEVGGGCRGRGLQLVDDTSSTSTFFCSNSGVCIVPQDCLDWGPAGLWEVINRWKLLCDVTAAPGLWRLTPFLFLLVAVIVMIRILELFLLHLLSMADFNCNCSCCWNKRDFNFMVCQSFPNGRTDGRTSPDILRIPSWNVKGETWLYGLIKIQAVKFSQVSNTRNK